VRAAGGAGDLARMEDLATRLSALVEGDAVARAALARVALARGDVARAEELARGAQGAPELARVVAEVALARGDGEAALESLAEAPEAPRDLLDRAARAVALAGGPPSCPCWWSGCTATPWRGRRSPAGVEVARVRGELDRPSSWP